MPHIHKLTFIVILASITSGACATDQVLGRPDDNKSTPLIQSAKDLDGYLRTATNSPLDRLSATAKQRFLSSLVFTENGFGGFSYAELENLSATEVFQILSLFGAEETTPMINARVSTDSDEAVMQLLPEGDHDGYQCVARADCQESQKHICMHSC